MLHLLTEPGPVETRKIEQFPVRSRSMEDWAFIQIHGSQ
jgi:hypothetical protein